MNRHKCGKKRPCFQKRFYSTKDDANLTLLRIIGQKPWETALEVYFCPRTGYWHIGHSREKLLVKKLLLSNRSGAAKPKPKTRVLRFPAR